VDDATEVSIDEVKRNRRNVWGDKRIVGKAAGHGA
jgi:hypothetical protein